MMQTRCPHCGTTFRIAAEQLKARQGRVRCGKCQGVFDALAALVTAEADEPVREAPVAEAVAMPMAPPPLSAPSETVPPPLIEEERPISESLPEPEEPAEPAAVPEAAVPPEPAPEAEAEFPSELEHPAAPQHPAEPEAEPAPIEPPAPAEPPPKIESETPEGPEAPAPAAEEAGPAPEAEETKPDSTAEGIEPEPELEEPKLEPVIEVAESAESNPESNPEAKPEAKPEAEPQVVSVPPAIAAEPLLHEEESPRPRRRWPWVLGSLLALVALAAQALLHFRTEVIVILPEARPLFAAACDALGCELALPRKIDLIGIETSELSPDKGKEGRLNLSATLRNRASYAQAWPHLEITLTDAQDRALLRRALAPVEYLPAGQSVAAGFPGQSEQGVQLTLDVGDTPAVGYRLYIFHP